MTKIINFKKSSLSPRFSFSCLSFCLTKQIIMWSLILIDVSFQPSCYLVHFHILQWRSKQAAAFIFACFILFWKKTWTKFVKIVGDDQKCQYLTKYTKVLIDNFWKNGVQISIRGCIFLKIKNGYNCDHSAQSCSIAYNTYWKMYLEERTIH